MLLAEADLYSEVALTLKQYTCGTWCLTSCSAISGTNSGVVLFSE